MRRALALVTLAAVVIGCRDEKNAVDGRHGETTITSSRVPVGNEAAMARLVSARCERETACANVGPDKHYADHDVCRHEVSTALRSDLAASRCPRGISAKELDACVAAIASAACNNAFDTIARIAACRTSALCLRADDGR